MCVCLSMYVWAHARACVRVYVSNMCASICMQVVDLRQEGAFSFGGTQVSVEDAPSTQESALKTFDRCKADVRYHTCFEALLVPYKKVSLPLVLIVT